MSSLQLVSWLQKECDFDDPKSETWLETTHHPKTGNI